MWLAHFLTMHSFSSYPEHLITALFQLCWPLNAFYLFPIHVAFRNPNICPSHYRKCLKEGIPNICPKTVTYRAGYSKNRARRSGPPAPPESVLYKEASPSYGREFSDTLLQGCTQKQGWLKGAVSFPAVVAYLNSLPLRSVPLWGLAVLSTVCDVWHLRCPSLMAGTVLPLRSRKVEVA